MRLVRGNALINEIGAIRQARAAGQLSLVEAIDEGLSSLSQKRRTKAKQCDLVLCQKGQELISMRLRCLLSTRSLREGSMRVKPFLHLLWLKSVACNHGQIQETTTRDRTARNPLRERHLSVALRSSSVTPSDVWYPGGESDVDRDPVSKIFTIPGNGPA